MHTVWSIGAKDSSAADFALNPGGYAAFVSGFGGDRTVYNIGYSQPGKDWPYVMPGPLDGWAGAGYWAGMHPRHFPRIFFRLRQPQAGRSYRLTIGFADSHDKNPPLLEVDVNGHREQRQLLPGKGKLTASRETGAMPQSLTVEIPASWLQDGVNEIRLGSKTGSWAQFDHLTLESASPVVVSNGHQTLIMNARAAEFEYRKSGGNIQPVLLNLVRLGEAGNIRVQVEGLPPVVKRLEKGAAILEIPMPARKPGEPARKRKVQVSDGGREIFSGFVTNSRQRLHEVSDYADLLIGTGNSRWMFKPGPSLPLSMVQIAPDNQDQVWKAGYEYTIDNIMGFSHFSDWTICGLLTMPTGGPLQVNPGKENDPDAGYRSRIDKRTESARVGRYAVSLTDTKIKAEVTATRHASLQRYIFPAMDSARVLIDLFTPNEYPHNLTDARITRTGPGEIEGYATYFNAFTGYSLEQSYTVHFVMQFSRPFHSMGGWANDSVPVVKRYIPNWNMHHEHAAPPRIFPLADTVSGKGDAGAFVHFSTREGDTILVRTGVSLVDARGARNNLEKEINNVSGWNFEAVVAQQRKVWNELLGRIEIDTDDYLQKVKFYTNLYRALSAKASWTDADGRYRDECEAIRQAPVGENIMSGEYWNTFWNNQQLFNLMAPEISAQWARSAIRLYKNSGWFNTDPAGVEHTGVMVAMHMASQLLGAWQSGIRDFDLPAAYTGLKKMMTAPPEKHPCGGTVGLEDGVPYAQYGYIPKGMGAVSNTLEYGFDDYCLSQMATILGKTEDARFFEKRSRNWMQLFDTTTGFIRPKDKDGNWVLPFDPYHTPGFVEGNAFNYTWFVPHDVDGLIARMGRNRFVRVLDSAMIRSAVANFNALGDNFSAYPINHGNEPTMHVAYLFNRAGEPWLTQRWSRAIQEQYYGCSPYDAYPGDEDLGQMSSWFIMSAIGLFQPDGGCGPAPVYELGSPRYPRIVLHLDGRYGRGKTFEIRAHGASADRKYIRSARLNGQPVTNWRVLQQDVLKGGVLEMEMTDVAPVR